MMNIVSMDGGAATALNLRLLRRLEVARPGFLSRVGLFSGTSDGALAAILLAALRGTHEDNLRALDRSIDIFHEIGAILRPTPRRALDFATSKGRSAIAGEFERLFSRYLGARVDLGDLEREGRRLVVPAYEKSTWRRCVFRSFDLDSDTERRRTLVDLALSCTAIVPMLPPHRSATDGRVYLDAAYLTNNPALVALQEACAHLRRRGSGQDGLLGQLSLLSLGTAVRAMQPNTPDRGPLSKLAGAVDQVDTVGWGMLLGRTLFLPDFLFHGSVDIIDLQCAELLGPRYQRVSAAIPELEWLVKVLLFPERLRNTLDEEAERRFGTALPSLEWVDTHVLAPASR
jgi:predicted acylesterase/phospholipase RssA